MFKFFANGKHLQLHVMAVELVMLVMLLVVMALVAVVQMCYFGNGRSGGGDSGISVSKRG